MAYERNGFFTSFKVPVLFQTHRINCLIMIKFGGWKRKPPFYWSVYTEHSGSAVFVVLKHKQQKGEKGAVVYQVCNSVYMCVSPPQRMRVCWRGGVSADVIGPCLSPWLMAIGHRLSPLYFFCSPALSSQVSHWSSALRHRIIYCCQESQGRERVWGGVGVRKGGECCREKPMEAMGRGRHARLSNLSRWIFNGAWSVYLVSLSIFTALSIAAPV